MRPVQLRASSTAASSMILASRTASRVGRCAASALGPVATEGCAATGGCACGWPLGLLGPALAARMVAPFRLALPPSLLGFLGRFLWIGSSPEPLQHTQTSNLRHLRHIWVCPAGSCRVLHLGYLHEHMSWRMLNSALLGCGKLPVLGGKPHAKSSAELIEKG